MIKLRARHETIRRRPCRAGSKRGGRKRTQARCAHGRMGDLASRTEDKLPGDRTQKDERHGHPLPLAGTAATTTSGELARSQREPDAESPTEPTPHAHLPAPSLFMRAARGPAAATARLRSARHRRPINDSYTGRSGQVLGWKPGTKLRIGWLEDSRIVLGQEARLGLTCPLICFSFS